MTPPSTIAHYRITSKLGEGGMGAVYRAVDTRLDREVAIKVLPAAVSADAERLARFEREAKVLASLNHPNIASVYSVEQGALIMELVEGENLHGPLRIAVALDYARQIASGLEAAHDKGVIHRDLKPANIRITPDGAVKILDFGLAKAVDDLPETAGSPTISPTLSMSMTRAGVILGTAAYMSPEQARGKPADKRSDIWAFGVVLYEMLAGCRPFADGEMISDTLASVMKDQPEWTKLPPDTPVHVRGLLERCLRKDPKARLKDAGDVRLLLEDPVEIVPAGGRRRIGPWVAAAGLAGLLLGLLVGMKVLRPEAVEMDSTRFVLRLPEGFALPANAGSPHYIPSPDGTRIAFVAADAKTGKHHLWIQAFRSLQAQRLDKSEGARLPFWSPDSRFIGFFVEDRLMRVSISGGTPQTITDDSQGGLGGTWGPAGIVLGGTRGLFRVAAEGGVPEPITTVESDTGEMRHVWPQFLPDGRHFLYLARGRDGTDQSAVYVQELGSPRRTLLMKNLTRAEYAPPGYLLFVREGALFARRIDPRTFEFQGEPVSLAHEVIANDNGGPASFAVSPGGVLVYRTGASKQERQLSWYNRKGVPLGTVGAPGKNNSVSLSPDEKYAAVIRSGDTVTSRDTWIVDLRTGISTPLTSGSNQAQYTFAAWSPDSQRIAVGRAAGLSEIALASRTVSILTNDPDVVYPVDWLPDGRHLVCTDANARTVSLLPLVPEAGERKSQMLTNDPGGKFKIRLSPDGKFVSYAESSGGSNQAYVASFPSFTDRRRISANGGGWVEWRRDGKELFFLAPDNTLMAVDIRSGPGLEAGLPRPLFKMRVFGPIGIPQYAVGENGQKFLVNEIRGDVGQDQIVVVRNWTTEIKK